MCDKVLLARAAAVKEKEKERKFEYETEHISNEIRAVEATAQRHQNGKANK